MSDYDSTLPRRQLGRYLREYRDRAHLSLEEASTLMQWSKSPLQRLEKGQTEKVRTVDIAELCRIYDIPPEVTEELHKLAQQAAVKSWYHEFGDIVAGRLKVYLGLESWARRLTSYQEIVPGLLQTADYARTLTRATFPDTPDTEIDRHVQVRMQRQAIITRKTRPVVFEVVVHESAIRRVVGGPKIMAAQLRHLADAGTSPNITVRVLPFAAGYPQGIAPGPFVLMDFGEDAKGRPVEPPIVFLENLSANVYLEKPQDIARYHQLYGSIQQATLDTVTSKNLLRQVAKEHLA